MNFKNIILQLVKYENEQEWFEFKMNFDNVEILGEYISALSNSATLLERESAYIVWGIDNDSHDILGTNFDQYGDYKGEPLQNFLARNLSPSINFKFDETTLNNKRLVILTIPAAKDMPTSFKNNRFIRIASLKCNVKDYPQREKELFKKLNREELSIIEKESIYQDMSFEKLIAFYGSRGIVLNNETLEKNLDLRNREGKYNILAQLLSNNSHIPIRVAIFKGIDKTSNLFAIREFGNDCLLYTLDELLRYGDVLNLIQVDERERVVERKDIPLFDNDAFREAVINAVLHNKWVDLNEPMITVFSNRIEILSRGTLAPGQTVEGFYSGVSIPVNAKLSEIFLQLHISEKTGRGVPIIIKKYGRDAIKINDNNIIVVIPFNRINLNSGELRKNGNSDINNDIDNANEKVLNNRRKRIISEMQNNPNITKRELAEMMGISETAIDNNISILKKNNYIKRVGSNKNGYWQII